MNDPILTLGGVCRHGKIAVVLATAAVAAVTLALAVSPVARAQTLSKPLVATITEGGTYSGTIKNTNNSRVAAVQVATSEPVVIKGSTIESTTDNIRVTAGNADITVRNSTLRQLHPGVAGRLPGYALFVPDGAASAGRLVFTRNLIVGQTKTAPSNGGVLIRGWTNGQSDEQLTVLYNKMSNCNGMTSTATGWSNTTKVSLQHRFFGHRDVHDVPNFQVAWNWIQNDYGSSSCEDHISAYDSGGNAANLHDISNNLIDGAYPAGPASSRYSGGGIITDGTSASGTANTDQYINIHRNVVIDSMNYGLKITQGHHNRLTENTVVRDGKTSDGQNYLDDAALNAGAALALQNAKGTSYFGSHVVSGNRGGHAGGDDSNIFASECNTPCTVSNNTTTGETTTNEQAIRQAYFDRAAAAGVEFGPVR